MSEPIVITRELVKRGWSDFEPKLITGLLTGSVAAFLVSILSTYGVHLSALQENFIAVACFFLGGYLTPSTGTAVTKRIDAGLREVEQHTAATVTTVTAPTAVQTSRDAPSFTKVIQPEPEPVPSDPDSTPTTAYAAGPSILEQLRASSAASSTGTNAVDH